MYTLERVLDLVNAGDDIYCEAYKTDRYLIEGWLVIGFRFRFGYKDRIVWN